MPRPGVEVVAARAGDDLRCGIVGELEADVGAASVAGVGERRQAAGGVVAGVGVAAVAASPLGVDDGAAEV